MNELSATGDMNIRVVRFPWWTVLIAGILALIAAVGLVAFPWAPVSLLAFIIGFTFVSAGVSTLVMQRGVAAAVVGIILIIAGLIAAIFNDFTSSVIVYMLGFGLIFVGGVWLLLSLRGSALTLVPAIITLAAGIVTLIWPTFVLTIVAVIVGFFMFMLGVFLIAQAFRLKKLPPKLIQE